MFERPQAGERAILVQLAMPGIDTTIALEEFRELAQSAQANVVACVTGTRDTPEAKYYLGSGKAEEVRDAVSLHQAELVLVNHELSPSQERNLEKLCQCRVVDRSGLILDIFAQRAQSFEGKLQVELAQLEHLSTRLVRGWTHLERQKGGIGLRGPGETQLETDRRLLRERIKAIHKRLEKVEKSRDQNRRARQKAHLLTVSLVGYTNAGKSTLFNRLTGEKTYTADQLFATLDPSMRKLDIPGAASIILTDTVGFIRDLPHQLIAAFRATLEETVAADLLLHVIDIADPNWREHVFAVEQVLQEMGAMDIPVLQVFNKIDKKHWQPKMDLYDNGGKIWVSAHSGEGLELLKQAISSSLNGAYIEETVHLNASQAKLRAQLYQLGAVKQETNKNEGGWILQLKLTQAQKLRLLGD